MANNLVEQLAELYAKDPKRANWLGVPSITGTNDFGFIKVRHCEYVIPGTVYDFNFRSAYSSNPTISPVLSRAKVTVCGIWIPISLYVPALRDGAEVLAMKTDYSFPTINFRYADLKDRYKTANTLQERVQLYEYIPSNSLFTELNMWEPYYTPYSRLHYGDFDDQAVYPKGKNAIPLLGYYDFFRHYILNNQQTYHPIRLQGFSRKYYPDGFVFTQEPVDQIRTRRHFDKFFNAVRRIGNGGTAVNVDDSASFYPQGDDAYDISYPLGDFYFDLVGLQHLAHFAPIRKFHVIEGNYLWFNDDHFGEVRATYFSDFNTAYMSNENVEYASSTARIKADDDGFITMEQIYAGERMQNFMRRSMFKQSDYASFINAETGITPPTNLTKPLFLGSVSSWINYNDVISQAQTGTDDFVESNTSLGSRASLGFGRMVTGSLAGKNNRSFARFTAKEPGYFMLLEWIVPEVSYWQGYDPNYDKTTLMSLYYPEFDRSGFQDQQLVHLAEMIHTDPNAILTGTNVKNQFPFERMNFDLYNVSLMQVPAYWEHMTYRNRLTGQMVDATSYLPWNFHRDYDLDDYSSQGLSLNGEIASNSWKDRVAFENHVMNTYVEPEQFHNIYANTEGLDNIQCYYKFKIRKYQPLSHRFTSFN